MEINRIGSNTPSSPPPEGNVWTKLLNDLEKIQKLMADMKANPQNAMKDLDQVIDLAKQMDSLAKTIKKPPVSAPNFYKDFEGLVTYAKDLKSALVSGDSSEIARYEKDINEELGNIRHDILQG